MVSEIPDSLACGSYGVCNRSRLNQLPPIGSLLRFSSSESCHAISSPTSISSSSPSPFSEELMTVCQEESPEFLQQQYTYSDSERVLDDKLSPYFIISSSPSLVHANVLVNSNEVLTKIENRMKACGKTRVKTWKKYSKKKDLTQDEMDKKRDLANQQERTRMHRLNSALKNLRNAIPYEFSKHPPEKNLSKIKTLRIAIEYIRQLSKMLNED